MLRRKKEKTEDQVTVPPIDLQTPTNTSAALFSMGCFWGPDALFGIIPGVIRTRVGYAGGTTKNPTYHSIGDYIETVQVVYDPARISYENLLKTFWNNHSPTKKAWKRQYTSALYYHDEGQEKLAVETKKEYETKENTSVLTEILPEEEFYSAELYHQKYFLRQMPELIREFSNIYPSQDALVDSTAAARVNGYLGGYGSSEQLKQEIDELGLADEGREILEHIVRKHER